MVASVAAQQAEDDIRGPKALIEIPVPEPPTPWMSYALWGLLAVLLIAGLVWVLKSRSKPMVTAEDRAKKELDRLGREGSDLEAGEFALAASQVVRVFIERKFGLAAPKRTTEEFLHELSSKENQTLSSRMEPLRGFLKSCDMAKFAGAKLEVGDRGELVAKARAFVDAPEANKGKGAT
ncbi:DUF4381 family protein [Haloferula sp.]|uniref:DUF4381 family protein n=1 Tax=Haloferula sp. TaxID=2497595 RepID=UPI00329F899B